jgi:hypothetical protein
LKKQRFLLRFPPIPADYVDLKRIHVVVPSIFIPLFSDACAGFEMRTGVRRPSMYA